MTEPNEQYAYFTVSGEFDPSELSNLVGVRPTESWRKGDLNPKTQYERKLSRWALYSRLERHRSVEDHIADVLYQMRANPVAFCEASTKYGGVMQLVAYFKTDYPGLNFDREIVKGLSEFSLSVDCDFYFLYSHRREDS
jgi:hypothetical protein